ncbi:hypothetical protein Q428_12300 [Fervidicella metallireducens AeB]|uniref:Uncharacterized protein n=1 Tax=Fervidicella metallireducens AeB TaxID=1403537 RepID=A0A017RSQ3_9CLOT|nr:hypothetical protein [Fervidicella metallireducens]EYE87611.1 hypothetical protein Q428_12300 [Fervidicella metallireducens AeB]
MKSKYLLIILTIFNVISFFINFGFYERYNKLIKNFNKTTIENATNSQNFEINLSELASYFNDSPDLSMLVQKFKLIKIVTDPIHALDEYDEGAKTGNKILSVSYGIEGIYQIDKNTLVKTTIIEDNTLENGNYIYTKSENSYETSFYKINNTFVLFDVILNSNLNESAVKEHMLKVISFKEKFYYHYKAYLMMKNNKN